MTEAANEEIGLFEAMFHCRAMRKIKPDPVPEELLVRLIEAGNQAPSGSNLQRARWIVVRDLEVKSELARLNKIAVEGYIGPLDGSGTALPHQNAGKRQRMIDAVLWQAENLHLIPALIIACMQFDKEVSELERAQAGGSIWPGIQNVLLAARGLGLGAAPTTLGLMDRPAAKGALGLPADMEAFCLIPVGWPMGNFGPVTRLPVKETMRWDHWA